jgi:hypothetical protein
MEFHSFQAAPESVASTVIAKNQGKVRSSAVEE